MKNNNILKMLANKAKNRLINKNLRNTYSNVDIKIITRNDDNFYNKVKEIMDEKTYVCNPLKRLMDEDKLMKMDARARERYLLETIEKYQEARHKIERERSAIV